MKRLLLIATLAVLVTALFSQPTENLVSKNNKPEYYLNPFIKNSYFNIALGTQLLLSQDVDQLNFSNRFTPIFNLSYGKWFTGWWGMEINLQGLSLNGFSTTNGIYTASNPDGDLYTSDPVREYVTINPDGTYRHYIHYVNMSFVLYTSMARLFSDYDENKKFDIIPSLGIGAMSVFEYKGIPKGNKISTNFGITGKYHINSNIDLNINVRESMFANNFEGRIAGDKSYDKYVSASIGLTYYFKGKKFKNSVAPVKISFSNRKLEKKVDTVRLTVVKTDTIYKTIRNTDTIYVFKPVPREKALSIIKKINIKFSLNSICTIDNSNDQKLAELANLLKNNSELKLHIIGHTCDISSYEKNLEIGMGRAISIKEYLVETGMDQNRIITESRSFSEPLIPNSCEENRAINRRVELVVE